MELVVADEQGSAYRQVDNDRLGSPVATPCYLPRAGSPREKFPRQRPEQERRIWVGGIPDELIAGISIDQMAPIGDTDCPIGHGLYPLARDTLAKILYPKLH